MASRTRSRRKHPAVELNITAFMNLMVVLVPFLLMTAVFTHITILDLNLPKPGSQQNQNENEVPYELRVTIRKKALILSDNKGGLIKKIDRLKNGHNYGLLKQLLKQVKARFPDKTNLTILSEPETFYDDLIQVMDSARSFQTLYEGEQVQAELFPDISIGDAASQ
ncbi:MAG: biopolymer transporter ExbD [Gammaproteobacteria bacterium]|nr:biopolymer transporter ExbD [Gammaproteobacteria bacterium]